MKAVRYVLLAIVSLIVLAVVAVGVAVAVIDPNTYKPQIEKAVEDATNLDLILGGDIGWSFIPLGLELNDVEATLEGERFVALEQLIAQVDFWSLVSMSPRVNTFLLEGLDARLEVNEQGEGNWTRIMPEGEAGESPEVAEAETQEEPAPDAGGEPLAFNVESVRIGNAQVHYTDRSTGQDVTLENFSLDASDITLGSEFPLSVGFRIETSEPQMAVDGNISVRLTANEPLNQFTMAGLDARFEMEGEPFGGEVVTARAEGAASANLENETASLNGLEVTLANLTLTSDLEVEGFGEQPKVAGRLAIAEFSLKELMANMGMPAIETSDPEVLQAIAFSTGIGGAPGKPELKDLTLKLDDTNFNGSGSYDLNTGGIVFRLQGNSLNADRYLPPTPEEAADEAEPETAAAEETDLLPLDTLRTLLLDIDFGLTELIISNLTIREIKASTQARDGLLEVDEFSGELYYGSFGANVTIDARSDNPQWSVNSDVSNVQTLPLLSDLAEMEMLSGGANAKVNLTTSGNRISALRDNADGEISFNLAEGEFRNMNLTRMACQGIALANQESLSNTDWGTGTPFNDMKGTLDIDGNTLTNTSLVAALAGMKLEGNGTVDLAESMLDYELGLRIVGEVHKDEACRVTEYVENIVIPVECRGNFTEDPAGLCSFDGSRFRDTLKDIAANAARAKVKEETDRAKRKAEEKAKEEIDERLGEEGEKVKDAIKGLFNR